jgi:hypothetical protein
MAVAQPNDLSRGQREGSGPIIHEDKIVPGAVHFGELQKHAPKTYRPTREVQVSFRQDWFIWLTAKALRQDARQPNVRQLLDCASPLALSRERVVQVE